MKFHFGSISGCEQNVIEVDSRKDSGRLEEEGDGSGGSSKRHAQSNPLV